MRAFLSGGLSFCDIPVAMRAAIEGERAEKVESYEGLKEVDLRVRAAAKAAVLRLADGR